MSTIAATLYAEAVRISEADLDITPEQEEALRVANVAFNAAREQVDAALRARKDKDQKQAEASALLETAKAALAAAQEPERKAEAKRWLESRAIVEQAWANMASEAFGTVHEMRYVNVVPTGEKTSDYYGERDVMRTSVDAEPIPDHVRGFEFGDFRITAQPNRDMDLTFEVSALSDEEYESGVRKDRFGYSADVRFSTSRYDSHGRQVVVGWGSVGASTIEDRETLVKVYNLAIALAKVVERVVTAK